MKEAIPTPQNTEHDPLRREDFDMAIRSWREMRGHAPDLKDPVHAVPFIIGALSPRRNLPQGNELRIDLEYVIRNGILHDSDENWDSIWHVIKHIEEVHVQSLKRTV